MPCQYGCVHHSNYPCKDPFHLNHILWARQENLQQHQHTCYLNHHHHSLVYCYRNLSALFVNGLQRYRFCTIVGQEQLCLKWALLSLDVHCLERLPPKRLLLRMTCHKLQHYHCSNFECQAIQQQNVCLNLLRRHGSQSSHYSLRWQILLLELVHIRVE